jgi:hypothetical protein
MPDTPLVNHEAILHININGFNSNSPDLQNLISSFDPLPIISINDTRTYSANPCSFPSHHSFLQDFPESGQAGGVAICIPPGWSGLRLDDVSKTDCLSLRVTSPSGFEFKMTTMYIHGSQKPCPHLFKQIVDCKPFGRDLPTVICGDFNSPHTSLGGSYNNASGVALSQIIEDLHLIPLNDFSIPTYFSASNASTNILDLFLSTSNFLPSFNEFSTIDSIGSDHMPILLTLTSRHKSPNISMVRHNWTSFRHTLESCPINLTPPENEQEINMWVSELTQNIQDAKKAAVTVKLVKTRNGFTITDESSRLIRLRRLLMRKRRTTMPDSGEGIVM